jgi:hypothetical protein
MKIGVHIVQRKSETREEEDDYEELSRKKVKCIQWFLWQLELTIYS